MFTQLIDQLKPGGRLIIPVGPQGYTQNLEQFDKDENGNIKSKKLMGVVYIPLTSRDKQCPGKVSINLFTLGGGGGGGEEGGHQGISEMHDKT